MVSRWQKIKYVLIGGFVITWISFFSWLNLTSEPSSALTEVTVEPVQKTCIDYRNQRDEIDTSFNAKANEGQTLIAYEFRENIRGLLGRGYLSKSDELLAKNYLSFSLIEGDSSSKTYSFSNYLNDRDKFEAIIKSFIVRNLLTLDYSPQVQAIGLEVHQLYLESQALLSSHPQCFKLDAEIYGYLESATSETASKFGIAEDGNGWVRARSVSELVGTLFIYAAPAPSKS